MKVKVSYAVDLSEVPEVLRQLISKNAEVLSQLTDLNDDLCVGDYGVSSHKKLETLAEKTASLSENYADCASILAGFLRTMVPVVTPEDDQELQNKIHQLKENSQENEENVKSRSA